MQPSSRDKPPVTRTPVLPPQLRTRKKGKKCGSLDMGDLHILRVLAEHIGTLLFDRLGSTDGDASVFKEVLLGEVSELPENFDCTGEEHDLWDMELNHLASVILDTVFTRTREKLQVLMGASAWQTMGLPQF